MYHRVWGGLLSGRVDYSISGLFTIIDLFGAYSHQRGIVLAGCLVVASETLNPKP